MINGKKVAGIIAEFNPFHEGHTYIISRAKEICSADYVVIVMSGDFVQRGAPAIFSKYERAEAALQHGADLVLQLPVMFSTAAAEDFAAASVALMERTGIVDTLVFGSESADEQQLRKAVSFLREEEPVFQAVLQQGLKQGMSYPRAKAEALKAMGICGEMRPNDILGIEYLKAMQQQEVSFGAALVRRELDFRSAHATRELYYQGKLQTEHKYLHPDDFSDMLNYQLLRLKREGINPCLYQDVSPEIGNRLMATAERPMRFTERIMFLKTKQYTYTRLARCLIHIMLEIQQDAVNETKAEGYISYLRVLGVREKCREILGCLSMPPIVSPARADEKIVSANKSFKYDIFAANVYNAIHGNFQTEYTRKLLTSVL